MSDLGARYAVCELVLRQGSLAADVALAREAGIGALSIDSTVVDQIGVDEARVILDAEGIRVSSYMGLAGILRRATDPSVTDDSEKRLDIAARLGAPSVLVLTGRLRDMAPVEADAICRDWLGRVAALAEPRGVRIMLEPTHPIMRRYSYVHTLRHALNLVEGVPNAGVLLDFGHVWWEEGLDALIRENLGEIVSVQVTNVDASALDEFRYERAQLDAGDVPVASLVGVLESCGYQGWYENEVIVSVPRDQRLAMLRSSREWFEAL